MEEQKPKSRRGSRSKATKKEDATPAPQPEKKDPGTIKIEIQKYKSLVDALREYRMVFRAILIIFMVGLLLFTGITAVVIAVKRFYPYSDIATNALGATTLKNEDKEVSYWLLNTAELWANSGIKVKKGQTITVRASGKKHTAMHHLYDDARGNNVKLQEPWVGTQGFTTGEDRREGNRDQTRAKYRIFPDENQDELLMQIVPVGGSPDLRPRFFAKSANGKHYYVKESENRFLVIGDRQDNIHIEQDGILYFGINDIVLDDATIIEMMWNISTGDYNRNFEEDALRVMPTLCDLRNSMFPSNRYTENSLDSLKIKDNKYKEFLEVFHKVPEAIERHNEKNELRFGDFEFGTTKGTQFIELYGYFMFRDKTPWYDDNLGSFLIVVESSSN